MDPIPSAAEFDDVTDVQSIFLNFKGRRAAIIKALTTDYDDFFKQCDPEKDNLCLYGLPNETWNVGLPVETVPPMILDPVLGINFVRDEMEQKHWLMLIALYSDSWLLSLAFYYGGRIVLNKSERQSLFNMINDLPTILETVIGTTNSSREESISGVKEDDVIPCGLCKKYSKDDLWICCDICETWYHGKCVKITQARAAKIKKYKCQSCNSKRRK